MIDFDLKHKSLGQEMRLVWLFTPTSSGMIMNGNHLESTTGSDAVHDLAISQIWQLDLGVDLAIRSND